MSVNVMDQIKDGLWLGNIMAASDRVLLRISGITHVLSLGAIPTNLDPNIKHMKVLIDDIPQAQIYPHLDTAVDFIKEALTTNGKVLVHW